MRESRVERMLRVGVEAEGGICEKFKSPEKSGVPDRLITWPGRVHFVEVKKPGESPEPHQLRDHQRRRDLGQLVFVLDSPEAVLWYLALGRHYRDTDGLAALGALRDHRRAWIYGNGQ